MATQYLVDKGYTRIALITTLVCQIQMQERAKGYLQTIQAAGFDYGDKLTLEIPLNHNLAFAMNAIADFRATHNPDAIFFATNYLGIYGLKSWRHDTVPSIGIVCFDDTDLFRLGKPAVTIVAQPIELIAKEAVSKLVSSIKKDNTNEVVHLRIVPRLIVREI